MQEGTIIAVVIRGDGGSGSGGDGRGIPVDGPSVLNIREEGGIFVCNWGSIPFFFHYFSFFFFLCAALAPTLLNILSGVSEAR